jgi:hypothetical protein
MVIGQAETHLENLVFNVEDAAPNEKDLDWQNLLNLEGLNEDQKSVVKSMLEKHAYLWDQKSLGVLHGTQHRIETNGNPVFQHPYRAGPAARKAEKEEVDRMLELGVIEPSNAEWASPVVLIPKPDGSTSFFALTTESLMH